MWIYKYIFNMALSFWSIIKDRSTTTASLWLKDITEVLLDYFAPRKIVWKIVSQNIIKGKYLRVGRECWQEYNRKLFVGMNFFLMCSYQQKVNMINWYHHTTSVFLQNNLLHQKCKKLALNGARIYVIDLEISSSL